MRIAAARLRPFCLPLVPPWRSAHGLLTERRGWLLELTDEEGRSGYGECAPLPAMGTEPAEEAGAWLAEWTGGCRGQQAAGLLNGLPEAGTAPPAARCAAEAALLDLTAQQAGVPLARLLDPAAAAAVAVNAAAGPLDDGAAARVGAALAAGFAVVKLKVGLAPLAQERMRLRRLSGEWPAARLRLDANGAWSRAEAERFIAGAAGLPVESLEEPLRTPTVAGLSGLQASAPFPLALDESLADPALRQALPLPRVVLKAPLLGGALPALALARRARSLGRECVVTTLLDGAAGRALALHLAAALGSGPAHGLATGGWLAKDLGEGPPAVAGRLVLPAAAGLGFTPDRL